MIEETYLGDSVYAEYHSGDIKLYLNNGEGGHNVIWLDQDVLKAFDRWRDALSKQSA